MGKNTPHFGPFNRGASVRCWVEVTDYETNALAEPSTSRTATLYDSEATQIWNAEALTKNATGKYYKSYVTLSTSPLGRWRGFFTMTSGTEISIQDFTFDLEV